MIITILTITLIGLGLIFFIGGGVGIIRLPDFYTRVHAAGMLDSMGLFLCMSGLALYTLVDFSFANLLSAAKIMLITVFVYITSPTATHMIVNAGIRAGLIPWTKDNCNSNSSEDI